MKSIFRIAFGKPKDGWLPVAIQHKEIIEEFYASDVPIDPLELLVDALFSSVNGFTKEVWWHLEPAGYFLTINNIENQFEVTLEYSKDSKKRSRKMLFKASGSYKEIILPIWRALSEFYSHSYSMPAWPAKPSDEMDKLKQFINKLKSKES